MPTGKPTSAGSNLVPAAVVSCPNNLAMSPSVAGRPVLSCPTFEPPAIIGLAARGPVVVSVALGNGPVPIPSAVLGVAIRAASPATTPS